MRNKNIPIIIPSYEPDELLIQLLEDLIRNGLDNIIIVNDGSDKEFNKYFDIARDKFDCIILEHEVNKGKGRALKTAFSYIIEHQVEAVGCITADSDGQHSPEDIELCMNKLIDNPNNLILGVREFSGDHVPVRSMLGNNITKFVFSFLSGIYVSDTQTGLRAIPMDFMRELIDVKGERFEFEMNMLIETRDKFDIIEVPIETIYESKTDHKSHFNAWSDSYKIYKLLGRLFVKFIISSVSSLVIDLALFYVFSRLFIDDFPLHYILISTVLARVISSIYNYVVNYKYVFKSKHNVSKSGLKYFGLAVIIMLLSAFFVSVINGYSHTTELLIIKIIVDLVLFLMSYYIQRKYIF